MERETKIRIVKSIITKVLIEIRNSYPWLDYSELKIGRDSSLEGNETVVRLYFQTCTDKDGNVVKPPLGHKHATYYNEIYNVVGKELHEVFLDDEHIRKIKSGTWSWISDIPETSKAIEESHYGVELTIEIYKEKE